MEVTASRSETSSSGQNTSKNNKSKYMHFVGQVLYFIEYFTCTLESGIEVGQGITVGPGKFVKKNKHRALNKHRA